MNTAVSFIRFSGIADGVKLVAVSAAGISGMFSTAADGSAPVPVAGEVKSTISFVPAEGVSDYYLAAAPVSLTEGATVRTEDSEWKVTGTSILAEGKTLEIGQVLDFGTAEPNGKIPAGMLNFGFSISPTRKVHFSKGNLKASTKDGWKTADWAFYDRQYEATKVDWSTPDDKLIDQFTWGYDPAFSTDPVTNLYCRTFTDYGTAFGAAAPWRTLTRDEWTYLLDERGKGDKFFKAGVQVCDRVNCLVIAPDGNDIPIQDTYDAGTSAAAEAAGMVCLPSSGYRDGPSGNCKCEYGIFWSSTPFGRYFGYSMFFHCEEQSFEYGGNVITRPFPEEKVDPAYGGYRYRGYFVRLVAE